MFRRFHQFHQCPDILKHGRRIGIPAFRRIRQSSGKDPVQFFQGIPSTADVRAVILVQFPAAHSQHHGGQDTPQQQAAHAVNIRLLSQPQQTVVLIQNFRRGEAFRGKDHGILDHGGFHVRLQRPGAAEVQQVSDTHIRPFQTAVSEKHISILNVTEEVSRLVNPFQSQKGLFDHPAGGMDPGQTAGFQGRLRIRSVRNIPEKLPEGHSLFVHPIQQTENALRYIDIHFAPMMDGGGIQVLPDTDDPAGAGRKLLADDPLLIQTLPVLPQLLPGCLVLRILRADHAAPAAELSEPGGHTFLDGVAPAAAGQGSRIDHRGAAAADGLAGDGIFLISAAEFVSRHKQPLLPGIPFLIHWYHSCFFPSAAVFFQYNGKHTVLQGFLLRRRFFILSIPSPEGGWFFCFFRQNHPSGEYGRMNTSQSTKLWRYSYENEHHTV